MSVALLLPFPMLLGISFYHLFSSFLVCTFIYFVWRWFFRPLEIRRQDDPLPKNESRRLGPIPDSYPTGWFRLCFSQEVPRGRPRSFPAFGSSLLVFRGTEDGKVHVLDPYCPHLGADLQDGKVVGDCVECPFHGWRFRGSDGKCAHIPYSDAAIPAQAQVEAWSARESHGIVMVWYDAIKRAPFWEPQLMEGRLTLHGISEHRVGCAIQEIPENGADISHLDYVHGGFMIGNVRSMSHLWTDVTWTPAPAPNEHLAHIKLTETFAICGLALPFTAIPVTILQMGLGMVQLSFTTPFGKVLVIESVTPKLPLEQRAGHVVLAERWVPRFVAKFVLQSLLIQFERDLPIWNKKTFVSPPLAVKGDGPLLSYRRWAAKLYPPKISNPSSSSASNHQSSCSRSSPSASSSPASCTRANSVSSADSTTQCKADATAW